jgi:hypothetical protein
MSPSRRDNTCILNVNNNVIIVVRRESPSSHLFLPVHSIPTHGIAISISLLTIIITQHRYHEISSVNDLPPTSTQRLRPAAAASITVFTRYQS